MTGAWPVEAAEHIQQSRFPAAGRSHDADVIPGINVEGNAAQRRNRYRSHVVDFFHAYQAHDCFGAREIFRRRHHNFAPPFLGGSETEGAFSSSSGPVTRL